MWPVAFVLVLLWTAGVVTHFTLHGFIHVLLIVAIITVFFQVYRGTHVVKL